jgi:hypothetical protein
MHVDFLFTFKCRSKMAITDEGEREEVSEAKQNS